MFKQNFKTVKFFNIDNNLLTKLINITINKSQDKRFSITNIRNDAQMILKNPLLQISPYVNDKQLSNIIHNATTLSNKANFISVVPKEAIPKTIIFDKSIKNMEKELYNNFSNERIIIKPVSDSLGRGIKLYDNIGDFINYSKFVFLSS